MPETKPYDDIDDFLFEWLRSEIYKPVKHEKQLPGSVSPLVDDAGSKTKKLKVCSR